MRLLQNRQSRKPAWPTANTSFVPFFPATSFSPVSGPATGSFNGLHPKSNSLAFINGGTIRRAPAAEHADEMWFEVIEVNLNAQFLLSREIGARIIQRGLGKIIFTASLLTFQGGITVPGYAASKGGIGQLAKAHSNEWASTSGHRRASR